MNPKHPKYRLLQDYTHPFGKTHKGTVKTIDEWKSTFPKIQVEDFIIKDDWFELVEEEVGEKKIEVDVFQDYMSSTKFYTTDKGSYHPYHLNVYGSTLSKEQLELIKKVIEQALNLTTASKEEEKPIFDANKIHEQLARLKGIEEGFSAAREGIDECSFYKYKSLEDYKKHISDLVPPTPSEDKGVESSAVLFTTEDGVDIFGGEYLHCVDENWDIISDSCHNKFEADLWANSKDKTFHSREKAQEYITLNKPLFSIQEIMNRLHAYFADGGLAALANLKQLAKKQIKSTL